MSAAATGTATQLADGKWNVKVEGYSDEANWDLALDTRKPLASAAAGKTYALTAINRIDVDGDTVGNRKWIEIPYATEGDME